MFFMRKLGALTKSEKALFDFLYQNYYPKAYQVAFEITKNSVSAEDIAHMAFEKAMERFEDLEDTDHFAKWLKTTTRNLAIDEFRRIKRHRKADRVFEGNKMNAYHQYNPEELFLEEEEKAYMASEVGSLKPIYRRVAYLRFFCELTFAEIAEQLDISENAARTRCFRARNYLRKKMLAGSKAEANTKEEVR
jgi:RNA polymerase sigma-70 factor, ECF subfamily